MRPRRAPPPAPRRRHNNNREPPPPLLPPLPPAPSIPLPAAAIEPFALDGAQSLASNVHRLAAASLQRPLGAEEAATLDTALEEALSVLQAGGAEARRQLLDADALHALATPSAAFLWATSLEATEDTVSSVSTMATAIVKSCSDIAAVLFLCVGARAVRTQRRSWPGCVCLGSPRPPRWVSTPWETCSGWLGRLGPKTRQAAKRASAGSVKRALRAATCLSIDMIVV